MLKTYEVMTYALATCSPETSIARVAEIMRERDIGNVLVVEEGRLSGIVTDRDLALQALTGDHDPQLTPVSSFMTTKLVTGEAEWSLEQAAKTMAEHQIRRLPIVQDGLLVGIVSLGDVALHEEKKDVVTKSLQAISTPNNMSVSNHSGRSGALAGLALALLATTLIAWLNWSQSGQALRKEIKSSKLYHSARDAFGSAIELVDDAASSKSMRDRRNQIRATFKDISSQLPSIEYSPPRRRHA
jgi:CBS domain-containing protein